MSSDWMAQYSAALDERDAREQAHKPYIDAYTRLADRTSSLEAPPPSALAPVAEAKPRTSTPTKRAAGTANAPSSPSEALARLRTDLAATQKARAALQAQAGELTTTLVAQQAEARTHTRQIGELARQQRLLERKVRDRDDEVRAKSTLAERAQDEMVALGLQLSVAEQRSGGLERENRELVDRWMERMGEEAERVNRGSGWE